MPSPLVCVRRTAGKGIFPPNTGFCCAHTASPVSINKCRTRSTTGWRLGSRSLFRKGCTFVGGARLARCRNTSNPCTYYDSKTAEGELRGVRQREPHLLDRPYFATGPNRVRRPEMGGPSVDSGMRHSGTKRTSPVSTSRTIRNSSTW